MTGAGPLDRALVADAKWMEAQLERLPPGDAHALNLQCILFRFRLSLDFAFYAQTWSRIMADERLWDQIRVFVQDVGQDWRARNEKRPTPKTRPIPKDKMRQRVQRDYLAPYYQPPRKEGTHHHYHTVFDPEAPPPAMPTGWAPLPMPHPGPGHSATYFVLIQLVKETFEVSRRIYEMWAGAMGRRVSPDLDLFPTDPDEDQFFLDLMAVVVSRVIPIRFFLMKKPDQRDALLAQPTSLSMPAADYVALRTAWKSHVHPDREFSTIIEEGARVLVDTGAPELAQQLIEEYLPLMEKEEIPALLYQDYFLALMDQEKWEEALKAAQRFATSANDDFLAFQARLCTYQAKRHVEANFDADAEAAAIIAAAQAANEPKDRVSRLLDAAVEFHAARRMRLVERALSDATDAAAGDPDSLQAVVSFRPRPPGRPRRNSHLFGTPGFAFATLPRLRESYYQAYPNERPSGTTSESQGQDQRIGRSEGQENDNHE